MDGVAHLVRLFAYDAWANREVLSGLRLATPPPPRPLRFIAHILAAQRLWLERLEQQPQSIAVWPDFSLQECERQAAEMASLWTNYLAGKSEADLAATVAYKNTQGQNWSSRKDDILIHVVMHSAYHRGQIATDVRAAGVHPAYTDFIHSIRMGFVE